MEDNGGKALRWMQIKIWSDFENCRLTKMKNDSEENISFYFQFFLSNKFLPPYILDEYRSRVHTLGFFHFILIIVSLIQCCWGFFLYYVAFFVVIILMFMHIFCILIDGSFLQFPIIFKGQ